MTLHSVRVVGLIALIVLCTFYPVLPGEYDPMAIFFISNGPDVRGGWTARFTGRDRVADI